MPPKRRTRSSTAAVATRTLRDFSGSRVSKASVDSPTGKKTAAAAAGTSKKRKLVETVVEDEKEVVVEEEKRADSAVETPAPLIQQDGDEDVVVRKPAAASAAPLPKRTVKKKKTAAATPGSRKRTKLDEFVARSPSPSPPPPAPSSAAKSAPPVTVASTPAKAASRSTAPTTPSSRKRTQLDEFITRSPSCSPPPSTPTASQPAATPSSRSRTTKPDAKTRLDDFITRTPKKPHSEDKAHAPLPESLATLVALHSSLLTALLLHKGQHQIAGILPAFSTLRPHVERLAKRELGLDELRRIVWISRYGEEEGAREGLRLVDYSRGKICVDFREGEMKLVQVDRLRRDFAARVRRWVEDRAVAEGKQEEEEEPKPQLPTPASSFDPSMAAVSECDEAEEKTSSAIPLAPLHAHAHAAALKTIQHSAKAASLLADLKASKPAAASATLSAKSKSAPPTPAAPAASRASSLLDRIRAKAAEQAAKPPPTAAELVAAAAKGRLPEVRETLRGYRARGSLGLDEVVRGVRESARNPIGATEAEAAVRLCAQAEEWVQVREAGGVAAVVFTKEMGAWGGVGK